MNREHRAGLVEIRATQVEGKPGVTLHAIKPGVVDDYGSLWSPDTFDKSLARRLPTLCWSHDWSEPLGPGTGFRLGTDGPSVDFVFSDFDAVPMARRAYAQVQDGTIQDCSVGFSNTKRRDPTDEEIAQYPGVREVILEADLDEISLVMRGAVPGAKVLAVRSDETVSKQVAANIIAQLGAGTIDLADALQQLKGETPERPGDDEVEVPLEEPPVVEDDPELDAEVDQALALVNSL